MWHADLRLFIASMTLSGHHSGGSFGRTESSSFAATAAMSTTVTPARCVEAVLMALIPVFFFLVKCMTYTSSSSSTMFTFAQSNRLLLTSKDDLLPKQSRTTFLRFAGEAPSGVETSAIARREHETGASGERARVVDGRVSGRCDATATFGARVCVGGKTQHLRILQIRVPEKHDGESSSTDIMRELQPGSRLVS